MQKFIEILELFKSIAIDMIDKVDKHEGFLTTIIGLGTVLIALEALKTWKKELKAKKLFEIHSASYTLLKNFQSKLDYLNKWYKEQDDDEFIKCFVTNQIGLFCRKELKTLQDLTTNLSIVDKKDTTLYFFLGKFKEYSKMESDLYTGSGKEDRYLNNFYSEYFSLTDNGYFKEFHTNFNHKVETAIEHFYKKMEEFYK